eukprot:7994138-Karenia_brevis.AAC.1
MPPGVYHEVIESPNCKVYYDAGGGVYREPAQAKCVHASSTLFYFCATEVVRQAVCMSPLKQNASLL